MKVRRIHHHVRLALKKRDKQILLNFVDHDRSENDGGFLADETSSPPSRRDSVEDDDDDFIYIDLQRSSTAESHVAAPSSPSSDYAILSRPVQIKDGDDKLYLNQYDMALVQVAFIAGVVIDPARLGINATMTELDDYIFTWRVFGWFLGAFHGFSSRRRDRVGQSVCPSRFLFCLQRLGETYAQYWDLFPFCPGLSFFVSFFRSVFLSMSFYHFSLSFLHIHSFLLSLNSRVSCRYPRPF